MILHELFVSPYPIDIGKDRNTHIYTRTLLNIFQHTRYTAMLQKHCSAAVNPDWTLPTGEEVAQYNEDQAPDEHLQSLNRSNLPNSEPPGHALLSWTACYNDGCPVHRSDKEGSGWFPRKPRKTHQLPQKGSLTQETRSTVNHAEADQSSDDVLRERASHRDLPLGSTRKVGSGLIRANTH